VAVAKASQVPVDKRPEVCLALMALTNTFREAPAATRLVRLMDKAVRHTKFFLEVARERMRSVANPRRRDNLDIAVNDYVLISTQNIKVQHEGTDKLYPRFIGPFKVVQRIGAVAYKVSLPPSMSRLHPVFHVHLLRKYKPPPNGPALPLQPLVVEGGQGLTVAYICGDRVREVGVSRNTHGRVTRRTVTEYLVHWTGFDKDNRVWVPESDLHAYKDVIDQYLAVKRDEQFRLGQHAPEEVNVLQLWAMSVKCKELVQRRAWSMDTLLAEAADCL